VANYCIAVVGFVDRQDELDYLHNTAMPDLVEVDDGTLGVMGNHVLTLEKAYDLAKKTGQEWVVILEDDAVPVVGFHRQLGAALDVAPAPIVSLYNGTGYPAQWQRRFAEAAARQDACWIMHPSMRHAVAYALHKECFGLGVIDKMLEMDRQRWAPDDSLTKWAKRWDQPIAYSNPSLCDHRDGPSVIAARRSFGMPAFGRKRPRVAHWTGARLTWDDSAVTIP
jgi:hypothetical protein